jgi:HD-like signal output (HDOD) protein
MIRVLFVDDEVPQLQRLDRQLLQMRERMDIRYSMSADRAIDALRQEPFDAVVADLRMPGTDGISLLDRVQSEFPQIARFMLLDEAPDGLAMRAMPIAHQLFCKPGDVRELTASIERVCRLGKRSLHPRIREALGRMRSIPSLPRLYWDLVRTIDRADCSAQSVAAIIEQDASLTARALQMANSAFLAPGRRIGSVREAVMRIGMLPIRSIVLAQYLVRAMAASAQPPGFSLDAVQSHSLRTAHAASAMVGSGPERVTAFSAGVLHGIGTVLMAVAMPFDYVDTRREAGDTGEPVHRVELRRYGCHHAHIGAYMLTLWGLPEALVDAVEHHHEPAEAGERFSAAAAVHVASALVGVPQRETGQFPAELDLPFLERVGVRDKLTVWHRELFAAL